MEAVMYKYNLICLLHLLLLSDNYNNTSKILNTYIDDAIIYPFPKHVSTTKEN